MSFIIIETHGGPEHAIVVTDTDGNIWCLKTVKKRRLKLPIARTA